MNELKNICDTYVDYIIAAALALVVLVLGSFDGRTQIEVERVTPGGVVVVNTLGEVSSAEVERCLGVGGLGLDANGVIDIAGVDNDRWQLAYVAYGACLGVEVEQVGQVLEAGDLVYVDGSAECLPRAWCERQ